MHLYLGSKPHGLIQPASIEAGFFDSTKGGDGYVDDSGLCPLRCGENYRFLEVVYSLQTFIPEWASKIVPAILALFWGKQITIE